MENSIEKDFVPYQESLELKELGFDKPCFALYGKSEGHLYMIHNDKFDVVDDIHFIKAPTFSQAFKWFREKYDLQCWPEPTGSNKYSCRYDGNDNTGQRWVGYLRNNENTILFYVTYEEAELECLKKLIEIVKEK